MSYKDNNKEDGFAEIVIPGAGGDGGQKGYAIPAGHRGKYAGKGAYRQDSAGQKADEKLCFEYDPGLAFVNKVSVYTWGAKRSFYERFRADAEKYRDLRGEPCAEVPFFSYIPQYSQMNLYQSNFYLYFRDMARQGEYIHADLSYILLYVYEIINLSDESDPAEDVKLLCGLWMTYREFYPALDKYMAEWVCDYCLLYRLPVPECTREILPKLCETATLREFYMSGAVKNGGVMQGEVLEAFADYDRRRSRVELDPKYDHHFSRALEAACSIYSADHFIADKPVILQRDAFCGSLCAHNVKRKIAVEYYPAFRRSGVRHMLGAAVKYTENKVRRLMGLKSRLHTDGLPDDAKANIDGYFAEQFPEVFRRKTVRTEETPEYERFYDAPDIPFSANAASAIEFESRMAAELLAALDEGEAQTPEKADITVVSEDPAEAAKEDVESFAFAYRDAIRHMLEGGELESWCRERGLLPDSVAGEINEAAMDFMGDALLENDGSWQLIPDYLEEAAEFIVSE